MEIRRLSTKRQTILRPLGWFPEAHLEQVAGSLRSKCKPKTPAQMRAAVRREVIRRHYSGRY